ncbi:U-box domain-containing protein 33-like isoform X1 [Trifolium pratense]|uniref:U-box domain-containing protein 33-like isoform X1 n=1 Tax=Trifolium pratense TaxID=57577 RepID=UPI001E690AC3|nr:U-box domain-containing protein 33-like isoform X1 [Trifolium pratense]
MNSIMDTRREIVEVNSSGVRDTIYVAVAKDVKDSKLNVIWAIQNSGGKNICILHVHVPAPKIPMMGGKFPANALTRQEVKAYREIESQDMHKTLDSYLLICQRMGVRANKLHIEMDCIEKGIIELISQHNIQNLVMGAASDKYHSRRMTSLRSKKAIYVCEKAPASCLIQFICKGYLIQTRDCSMDKLRVEGTSPLAKQMQNSEVGHSPHLRSKSISHDQELLHHRVRSMSSVSESGRSIASSVSSSEWFSTPQSKFDNEPSYSPSPSSVETAASNTNLISDGSENVLDLKSYLSSIKEEDLYHASPPSVLQDGRRDDSVYDQLEQAMAEAEKARWDAYQETVRRRKAEKDVLDVIRKNKDTKILYEEEVKLRKYLEEALEKAKEEIDNMRSQIEKVNKELELALDHKSSTENQIGEASRTQSLQLLSEFSFSEIEEATCNFNPSLKIGEGGYGSIFKGILRHTEVAIKMLNPNSTQGPSEFQQEVTVLSKLRHRNLVTLIGANQETRTLIYEYLPNGSLEDHLICNDSNTSPLSWQARIRIATELCSALIFLHSNKPHSIVHGDLKPSNILLDVNFVSKLSDFGICRILSCQDDSSSNNSSTQFWITKFAKGTFAYMDPEFFGTGELTTKSDVYSFGIVLLRLITGKLALGIKNEVLYALNNAGGELKSLLDPLAGDWPIAEAENLIHLALRCCDMNKRRRPELCSDVWKVLEPMRASCSGAITNTFGLMSCLDKQLNRTT